MRRIGLISADAGVYFSVVVGPVAGRFAAENGDSVSGPHSKASNMADIHVPVALVILRSRYRRLLFIPGPLLLLLPAQAPQRQVQRII